tara:strand:+ start:139 stop:450 length:312 start_codon:yes stop_codon:yes gene_type:complete
MSETFTTLKDGVRFTSLPDSAHFPAVIEDVDEFLGMHDATLLKEVLDDTPFAIEAQELLRVCWNHQASKFYQRRDGIYAIELPVVVEEYLFYYIVKPSPEDFS